MRGCSEDINNEEYGITYFCFENNCNTQIVPYYRLQCHQCGPNDANCLDNLMLENIYLKSCRNFSTEDSCYLYHDDKTGEYRRGCLSDQNIFTQKCEENDRNCYNCRENGCNSIAMLNSPSQYCVQCSEMNRGCEWGFPIGRAEICPTNIPFYADQGCFSYQYSDGRVRRGCLYEERDFCAQNNCRKCFKQECNRETYHFQSCIQCNSTTANSTECAEDPNSVGGDYCDPWTPFEKQGCYSYTDCELQETKVAVSQYNALI